MANLIPLAIADVELQLASAISVGATSFTLSSANDDDGNALPAGKYCFTLDSGTSNKEYLMGQVNGTAVTSVKSVSRQGVESNGAARAHRVGAPCIVTNFATLQRVADILRGQIDLDGASPVGYDTEPTLADRKDLATVGYVIDTAAGGTVAFDSQVITGTGGEAIVAGNLVYFKTSDQEWYLTDADTAATVEGVQLGIALGSGSDGVAISGGIQIAGTWSTTGLTAGSTYYAGNTAGAIASSAGTNQRTVGIALSSTKLLILPLNQIAISDFTPTPIGAIMPFAGSTAPANYLLCYGQAISRTTYSRLFTVLSTTYGVGDGSTTFNVPDLRGRVIAALDNLGGTSADIVTDTDADSLGGIDGEEDHILTTSELANHTHQYLSSVAGAASNDQYRFTTVLDEGTEPTYTTMGGSLNYPALQATGGDTPHNTMQPTIFMSYIIRAI